MAIRFKHQAGAGLIGAYASGQASAKRRGQKYATAKIMQNQRHEERMQELFGRNARRGGRGAGGQQLAKPLGEWREPEQPAMFEGGGKGGMGEVPQLPEKGTHKWHAMKRGNERARKNGRELPNPEIEPQFIPQEQIEQENKIAEEQRDFGMWQKKLGLQDGINDENRRGIEEFQQGETDLRDRREGNKRFIQKAPEWFTPEAKRDWDEQNTAERELRNKRKFSDNRDTQDALDEIEQERERLRIQNPEPDYRAEWNKGIMWRNRDGQVSETKGGEFSIPVRRNADKEYEDIPPSKREQDDAAQAEDELKQKQDRANAIVALAQKNYDIKLKAYNPEEPATKKPVWDDELKSAKEQIDRHETSRQGILQNGRTTSPEGDGAVVAPEPINPPPGPPPAPVEGATSEAVPQPVVTPVQPASPEGDRRYAQPSSNATDQVGVPETGIDKDGVGWYGDYSKDSGKPEGIPTNAVTDGNGNWAYSLDDDRVEILIAGGGKQQMTSGEFGMNQREIARELAASPEGNVSGGETQPEDPIQEIASFYLDLGLKDLLDPMALEEYRANPEMARADAAFFAGVREMPKASGKSVDDMSKAEVEKQYDAYKTLAASLGVPEAIGEADDFSDKWQTVKDLSSIHGKPNKRKDAFGEFSKKAMKNRPDLQPVLTITNDEDWATAEKGRKCLCPDGTIRIKT